MGIFGFESGKSLAILGLGPVGLSFVRLAKLKGMGPIVAMDIDDEKLALAKQLGADFTLNTRGMDIPAAVLECVPGGVDYALDAVGVPSFIGDGMAIVKPDAKVCVYGISEKMNAPLDWSKNPYNWTLQFNQFPQKKLEGACHDQIIAWIREGKLDPGFFVSHRIPFAEMGKAFEMIENREKMLELSRCSRYATPTAGAALAIVPCYRKEGLIAPDYAEIDLSACVENILLEVEELGLGAVWMGIAPGRDRMENVRAVMNVDESLEPFAIIAVGYPAAENKQQDRFDPARIHIVE
jgi:hypothetical protein